MKTLFACVLTLVVACGGSKPKATEPTTETKAADDPDNHGIGQAEVAAQACYEGCLDKGPANAPADWSTKSDADKQTACNAECKNAGAGMPSDQPAK